MEAKKQDDNQAGYFVGLLALVAVVTQREQQIRFWFYTHMVTITLLLCAACAGAAVFFLYRMKQKNEPELARMRALKKAKPGREENEYYKRGQ